MVPLGPLHSDEVIGKASWLDKASGCALWSGGDADCAPKLGRAAGWMGFMIKWNSGHDPLLGKVISWAFWLGGNSICILKLVVLEIVLYSQVVSSGFPFQVGPQATYHDWVGSLSGFPCHRLSSEIRQGYRLDFTEVVQGHCSYSIIIWGPETILNSWTVVLTWLLPKSSFRMDFVAAWIIWSGFWPRWNWRLSSVVGQGFKFASLPGWGLWMGFTAIVGHWVGTQIR